MKSISICRTDTTVQRRTSIQVLPVCVLRETEQSGHLNVRTVLRHYVPNKGLRPLRCFAAILVDINCLTNTPLKPCGGFSHISEEENLPAGVQHIFHNARKRGPRGPLFLIFGKLCAFQRQMFRFYTSAAVMMAIL